jgi:uncharacterized RDD family membrane protein YckC
MEESGPMFLDEDPEAPSAEAGPAIAWPEAGVSTPARTPEPAPARSPAPAPGPAQAPAQAPVAPRPAVPAQAQAAPAPAPAPAREEPRPQAAPAPWAQQVHDLARQGQGEQAEESAPMPWKPPVSDPFLLAAQEQARPASLGKRLVARVVDSLIVGAVAAVAAVPLGSAAYDHIQQKTDAARQTGETVTVWLIDGTTSVQLGIIAAVVLVTGLLYEVLPTAKWGRTLGKKLLKLKVLDIESQYEPGFAAALRRWLTHMVLDAVVIGFVGLAWCVFDRPWRQCWHDKAARTFVAGD